MDLTGLLNNILDGADMIYQGRKGFATDGEEHQGRLNYESGITTVSEAFKEALFCNDPKTIMLTDEAFIEQELQFCSEADTHTRASLTQALQSFDDAFLSLEAVEGSGYKEADKTYPHNPKYRTHGCPKDAFHLACIAHKTRLQNILRAPGINMIEKAVLQQRIANMTAAQNAYAAKQKIALKD